MPDLAPAVLTAWESFTRAEKGRERPTAPRDYCYASGRKPCVRWMALDLIYPGEAEEFSLDAMERMRRGDARERSIVSDLYHIGQRCTPRFEPREQQSTVEIRDRDGVLLIRGRMEGLLRFEPHAPHGDALSPGLRYDRNVVFEVKSGGLVERAQSLEDLDRNLWSRSYVDQVLVYALHRGLDALFILDRPGLPRLIELPLEEHLARAESFLQDARAAVDARFGRAELPPMTTDRTVCQKCPHLGKSCHPAMDFGEGVQFVDDGNVPGVVDAAEKLLALETAADEWEAAKKVLAEQLRGASTAIVDGRFLYQGKWSPNTTYPIPADVKAPYKKVEPKGKWLWTLTPLGESGASKLRAEDDGDGDALILEDAADNLSTIADRLEEEG